ncbi:MAG TPA: tRNA dihydrouridine synthase DusB [Bacteroidota bacterium]|nr:tRNA dihydrouridine synthase DusB [Bacteroidota bacterium]
MKIGSIEIAQPLLLAPMEDVTDAPFRLVCKRLGADIVYTEFVNSEGLVRENEKTRKKMFFSEEERPFGIQIYGGEEASMEGAARIAESLSPDLIDINCGCWVKDVAMRGAGAGLLKDLPRMERIVSSVVRVTRTPVSVKTRLGWDENSIRIVEVARMLEGVGVKALTVHCRTRAQAHKGVPDYSWIPKIKAAVSIPVFINGNIISPADVKKAFDDTGCDGVMIGRGAIDNPWIFRQSKAFLQTGKPSEEITLAERIALCVEHLKLSVEFKGERTGVLEMRKHYSGYLRGLPNIARLRAELMTYATRDPIIERLTRFSEEVSLGVKTPEERILV